MVLVFPLEVVAPLVFPLVHPLVLPSLDTHCDSLSSCQSQKHKFNLSVVPAVIVIMFPEKPVDVKPVNWHPYLKPREILSFLSVH